MRLEGVCPHGHCGDDQAFVVRRDDDVCHATCGSCGWPIILANQGASWSSEPGHWGLAGDPRVFHELVCALFHADPGAVNFGPDCYSGRLDGIAYARVEAKCYEAPVGAAVVRDAIQKYGQGDASLAVVAGHPGFTDPAVELAQGEGVHLFLVRRAQRTYAPIRLV